MTARSRREVLHTAGAVGSSLLVAGCSLGRHHRPDLSVSNSAASTHRVSVAVERRDGTTLFEKRVALDPDESTTYEGILPPPGTDGDATFRTTASLDTGASESVAFGVHSGFHAIWIEVESDRSVRILTTVH